MNIEAIKNRKGAQKAVDIPSEVLLLLNTGTIGTVNLTEWLAIDHSQLVKSVFPTLGIDKNIIEELVCQINQQKKPSKMNTIVADSHFGVREIIWMALRPEMSEYLDFSIAFLSHWAESEDENIRRFSTEALRPRGVWCAHIEALKEKPEQYLPILDKLKTDKAKYVQDSVGNWLNDASKTRPDFVMALCKRWENESPTKETKYIIKKALRTLASK